MEILKRKILIILHKLKAQEQNSEGKVKLMSHKEPKKEAKKGSKEKSKPKFVSQEDIEKHNSKGTIDGL